MSLNRFLAVKQYAFLTIFEGSAIKSFPQIRSFSGLLRNFISVIVQAENVLNAGLHLFQIRAIEFPL